MTTETFAAVTSMAGASIVAVLPTDPATIEAIAKWPLTLVLASVAIYAIYSMNKNQSRYMDSQEKQVKMFTDSIDKHSRALQTQAEQLAQRPCIRNPENN